MASDKENEEFGERVRSLRSELDSYGKEIMRQLTALYTNCGSATLVNLKSDPRNALKILRHDVVEMLSTCAAKSEYNRRFAADLAECDSLLQVLRTVSATGDALAQCEDAVVGADVLGACRQLSQLDESLAQLPSPNSELGSGQVCAILRREAASLRHRFHARLRRLLRHSLQFSVGACSVARRLRGIVPGEEAILEPPLPLRDLWAALALCPADLEHECVDWVVERAWGCLLRPLWRERKGAALPKVLAPSSAAAAAGVAGGAGGAGANGGNSGLERSGLGPAGRDRGDEHEESQNQPENPRESSAQTRPTQPPLVGQKHGCSWRRPPQRLRTGLRRGCPDTNATGSESPRSRKLSRGFGPCIGTRPG